MERKEPYCRDHRPSPEARAIGALKTRTREARGYGSAHRTLRRQMAAVVARGEGYCVRCGGRIAPGAPFHLGHVDGDRRRYAGIEHPKCNEAAAGRIGATVTNGKRHNEREREPKMILWSRVWFEPVPENVVLLQDDRSR